MSLEPDDLIPDDPPPAPPRAQGPAMITWVLAGLLAASTIGNIVLLRRGAHPEPVAATRVIPATTPCPVCPSCAVCAVCEPPPEPAPCPCAGDGGVTARRTSTGPGPATPRVDEAMAQEGEGHIAGATQTGEREPAHLGAQRSVINGVDRIADSHSAAAAERFITRNLPAIASMDCAFRDPALAEHVRMRLREMNRLVRPQLRLTEEQLTRYERDLRCPRE